jgi:hypothetical protein
MRPTIGRVVWYRSRTGLYSVPAIITATVDTLARGAVEAGIIPDLTDWQHVHLTVFSPGIPVIGPNSAPGSGSETAYVLPSGATSFNLAGTYQEWNVPFFDPGGLAVSCAPDAADDNLIAGDPPVLEQLAGSWTWPVRS